MSIICVIKDMSKSNFFESTSLLHFVEQLSSSVLVGIIKCSHNLVLALKDILFNCPYLLLQEHLLFYRTLKPFNLSASLLNFVFDLVDRIILLIFEFPPQYFVFFSKFVFSL